MNYYHLDEDLTHKTIIERLNRLWPLKKVKERDSWWYPDCLLIRNPEVRIHKNETCDGKKFFSYLTTEAKLLACSSQRFEILKQIFNLTPLYHDA